MQILKSNTSGKVMKDSLGRILYTMSTVPATGTIYVLKTVTDHPEDETYFHIKLTGQGEDASAVDGYVNQTGSITFNDLPFDEYVLTEIAQDGYNLVSVSGSVMLDADHLTGSIEVVNEVEQPNALELTFDDITNAPVSDAESVSEWNTFFDLPTNGTPFKSVVVVGNIIKLFGGNNIIVKEYLFLENVNIININDNASCIIFLSKQSLVNAYYLERVNLPNLITLESTSIASCPNLIELLLPSVEHIDEYAIADAILLKNFNFPNLLSIGDGCFQNCNSMETLYVPLCNSIGIDTTENGVFSEIIGQTITLTIPSALMICNGGNPDGDIQYLIDNNTVTIYNPSGVQIYPT